MQTSRHAWPIQRSASDTMLVLRTYKTSESFGSLSTAKSVEGTIAKPEDVQVGWDGRPTDIPLLFQLASAGLAGAVNGCAKVRHKAGKHARKLPFVGMSRVQILKHLARLRSSSSSSVPEMCRDQMIGLNFADESEANSFNTAISDRLAAKLKKREDRKRLSDQQSRPSSVHSVNHQHNVSHLHQQPPQPPVPSPQTKPHYASSYANDQRKKVTKKSNKKTSKLSKDEIGIPTNFVHITHVGFNPDTGFSQFNMDDKLEGFFNMVGVSQKQLSDTRTREFIYDFIEKNGGVEKAIQETQRHSSSRGTPPPTTLNMPPPPPPVKSSALPPPPPSAPSHALGTRTAPPPPPPRNATHGHPPPPPPPVFAPPLPPTHSHSRSMVPPPPVQVVAGKKTTPLPPLPPSATNHHQTPPPPPPTSTIPTLHHSKATAPPPPPPPPPPSNGLAPPPPPLPPTSGASGGGAASDSRSALLDEIKAGKSLKKVEPVERPASTDSRSQLMTQIRSGVKLNPVEDTSDANDPNADEPNLEGLALDLHRALVLRANAMQSDDDTDSDSEDDDWDDDDT